MRRFLFAFVLVALAGCGGSDIDAGASRQVWTSLRTAQVSQLWSVDTFVQQQGLRVECPGGGSGAANEVHTEAWAQPSEPVSADGQVTGHVAYALQDCTIDGLRLSGTLRRSFHVVQRVANDGQAPAQGISDVFFGTLSLDGSVRGSCEVDVVREIVQNEPARWEGTLCGHDARQVLGLEGR